MSLLFKIFLTVSIDPDRMALPNSFNVVSFWSFDIDMVAAYDFRSQSFRYFLDGRSPSRTGFLH